jgi:hypothetical protein
MKQSVRFKKGSATCPLHWAVLAEMNGDGDGGGKLERQSENTMDG